MESIKERILYYLDSKGISMNKAALECGLSASYFRNTNSYSAEAVAKLMEKYSDLSAEWVMRGKGDMLDLKIQIGQTSVGKNNTGTITTTAFSNAQNEIIKRLMDELSAIRKQNQELVEMLLKNGK